jgi:hypothetical protein
MGNMLVKVNKFRESITNFSARIKGIHYEKIKGRNKQSNITSFWKLLNICNEKRYFDAGKNKE